jgi:hypothetical protein
MGRIGSFIAPGARLGVSYAERLLAGVGPQDCGRLARPGGVTVQSNHPAFVLGHLSLYPARVMTNLQLPTGSTAAPTGYDELFKPGVECQDDPQAKIYPAMAEMKRFFTESYKAAIAAVEAAADGLFDLQNPTEGRSREMFPTVGAAVNFYLIGHVQMHLGQLSAWRRAMGLPPA